VRLDRFMVETGLSPTRSQAREAILRGAVRVDGVPVRRAGHRVAPHARVEADADAWVSRAARKLAAALDHYRIDPAGASALDIGASTGGFTEVLLRRGAARVIALDVGRGQFAPALAADPRVTLMEGVNARHLAPGDLPFAPDLVVADVSFISLTLVLPPALALAAPGALLAALVKPQFEVGPEHVGKGGIVRDDAAGRSALARVARTIEAAGWAARPAIPSPIEGGDGNREWLIAARGP
jgi:23S rRNA (cytidine1920-2'-O)/16S rRNA (cytidine1409-2'-O)-methyltransferase